MAGMYIYGELYRAQVERQSADPTAGVTSRLIFNTTSTQMKYDNGSAYRAFLANDQFCVFGNNATAANNVRWNRSATATLELLIGSDATAEGSSTPANWAKLNTKLGGSLVDTYLDHTEVATPASPAASTWRTYFKSDGKFYKLNSSGTESEIGGASAGGINYITNPDAEIATTGWSMYADAAATTPVDGTGGSPASTITRVTSSPLRGVGMFRITKSAANRQGEGVSYDFTIASADKAKPLAISFEYNPSSAFVAGDSSDIRVWIYDVTNAVLIGTAPYTIQGGSGANQKFIGTFQTNSNSTSYRLIFHIGTTNASAWTFDFDNVVVGPQMLNYGAPIGDWTLDANFAPSAGFGTVSGQNIYRRRVGDTMEVMGSFKCGTVAASTAYIQLPAGFVIDTTKITATASVQTIGMVNREASAATTLNTEPTSQGPLFYDGSTTNQVFIAYQAQTNALNKVNGSTWGSNSDEVSFFFQVPILGWGSNVVMSNDTDTRVVAARAYAQNISANNARINFSTVDFDTHGVITTGASWAYTCPVSGYYRVSSAVSSVSTSFGIQVYKNGSVEKQLGGISATTGVPVAGGSVVVSCKAGDTLDVRTAQNITTTNDTTSSWISIERLTGPAAIAATETVAARATTSVTNTASGIVVFTAKTYDTHGGFDVATGRYTCPTSGKYSVKAAVTYTSSAFSAGAAESLNLYKNAVQYSQIAYHQVEAAKTEPITLSGSDEIQCLAGDIIDIRTIGSSVALDGSAINNFVSIYRIGNY